MTDMTLEQVRDWHLHCAKHRTGHADGTFHHVCADAIDAAIKAQGEPVVWGYANGDVALSVGALKDCAHSTIKWNAPLYAAPPADDRFDSERNVRPGDIGTETDDLPTWEEVRAIAFAAWKSNPSMDETTSTCIDRIIAEFRKEKGK